MREQHPFMTQAIPRKPWKEMAQYFSKAERKELLTTNPICIKRYSSGIKENEKQSHNEGKLQKFVTHKPMPNIQLPKFAKQKKKC